LRGDERSISETTTDPGPTEDLAMDLALASLEGVAALVPLTLGEDAGSGSAKSE
jgi:hypothetical protein